MHGEYLLGIKSAALPKVLKAASRSQTQFPQNRFLSVTYGRLVCDVRELKSLKNSTVLTVGGEEIKYPGYCVIPTANLLTLNLLLNSVISTLVAKFMTLVIKKLLPQYTTGAI